MRAGALFAAALVGAACASAGARDGVDELVGCYQFEVSADSRALGLPWGFELSDEPLEGWSALPDAREAVTRLTATRVADHPFGFWEPVPEGGDSIRVGHPGGGGFLLVLAPEGQDLLGRGRAVGDAVAPGQAAGERPERAVVARRVLCPEPEPG